MDKKNFVFGVLFVVSLMVFLGGSVSSEITFDEDGKWEENFDYDFDWEQGDSPFGDFSGGGGWTCNPGEFGNQLIIDAKNPLSDGQRGFRHWQGDGTNNNAGGLNLVFQEKQKEFWIRFYHRYEEGFQWTYNEYHGMRVPHYDKILYIRTVTPGNAVFAHISTDGWRIPTQSPSGVRAAGADRGWHWTMGGPQSHGNFVCHEYYFKMDTNGTNGIGRYWQNGELLIESFNITYSTLDLDNVQDRDLEAREGWTHFLVGSNQNRPDNGRCMYVDYDDIVIYNQDPPNTDAEGNPSIGPIDWNDSSVVDCQDSDNDGYNSSSCGGSDCNDSNPNINPGVNEICDNGLDDDCDGLIDSEDSDCEYFGIQEGNILLREDFEDTNFADRGWYDAPLGALSIEEHVNGSSSSFECTFLEGGTGCSQGTPGRHKFNASEKIYLSYWVKYSEDYTGSNRAYHPHEFNFVTNVDSDWIGPAGTHLTTYVEQNEGVPRLALQDMLNVDTDCIRLNNGNWQGVSGCSQDYDFTEERSVAACNGLEGYVDGSDCFQWDSTNWYSARSWDAGDVYFKDQEGDYYKNDWHYIEAVFEMNSIENGESVTDGKIRYWYDGELLISLDNILFKTGENSNMKFDQFLFGMYIGDGSPIEQTMWIDNLTVSDYRVDSMFYKNNKTQFHPADINPQDGVVSFTEIQDYLDRWLNGEITINELLDGVNEWRGL